MPDPHAARRTALETSTAVVAAVFLAAGVVGLLSANGTRHGAGLIGCDGVAAEPLAVGIPMVFGVVHLGFGVTGLLSARGPTRARWFSLGGGVLYLMLVLSGSAVAPSPIPKHLLSIAVEAPDGLWWQVGLAVMMITLGTVLP